MVSVSSIYIKRSDVTEPVGSSRWTAKYRLLVMVVDALAITLGMFAAYYFKFGDATTGLPVRGASFTYDQAALAIALLWFIALARSESWSQLVLGHSIAETRAVLTATLGAFGVVAITSYLAQVSFSRAVFVTALPLGCLLLLTGRLLCRIRLRRLRRRGRGLTPTIIVGDPLDALHTIRHIDRHALAGYRPAAVCVVGGDEQAFRALLVRERRDPLRLVTLDDIPAHAAALQTSAVAVAGGITRQQVRALAWALENSRTELMMVSRLTDVAGPRVRMSNVEGLGLVHVQLPQYNGINHVLKRTFDIFFSAITLCLIAPLLIAIAIAIKLDDGGPIMFRQERVGVRGRPFIIHKLRTMCPDAELQIEALIKANGGRALLFKEENDPRVTRVGRLLRKYSLDELPQFWTVLRGAMSVVGPRPQVAREVAEYDSATRRRLLIKPGITGLWQVSGRSQLSVEESIQLDVGYVENWSLTGDLAIIGRTVAVVFFPKGAY